MKIIAYIKDFFLGKALAQSDDPFENVKYQVLLNFSLFFLASNIPYTIISYNSFISHFISAIVQNCAMLTVIILLKQARYLKTAVIVFMLNLLLQNVYHFFINNGLLLHQGVLFNLLTVTLVFILMGRSWGFIVMLFVGALTATGIYNENSNFSLWHFSASLADPSLEANMKYTIFLPFFLSVYLISEFVRVQNKARKQLNDQKQLVVEKNREILDSIRYAKRIQKSLLPNEKYIVRVLNEVKVKRK
jgi:hypothetical protein